jgi:hypothetical protein
MPAESASLGAEAQAQPTEPDWGATAPSEPVATGEPYESYEPAPSAAEIESWPSQDVSSSPTSGPIDDRPAWPTEPPAAGSAAADAWPTAAPERDAMAGPPAEPSWEGGAVSEPPPSEIEAYPADTTPPAETTVPPAGALTPEPVAPMAAAAATPAQSVPPSEAAVGESTLCPRCGTENRPGLAFCRNCGQRLVAAGVATTVERPSAPEGTMACPRCGTHNRAGTAFCQNCGANLRASAPGYVPPPVAAEGAPPVAVTERRGAVLGPVVLLIGVIGLVTGYLLPFLYGSGSLFDRAYGSDGYGVAFWNGYPDVGANLADQAYFGLAAPVPLLAALLVILAIAGFARAAPGALQRIGLVVALLWSVALIVLFVIVELAGNWNGDLVGMLRALSPAGIIFFLASLIVLIGTLTRFGRS